MLTFFFQSNASAYHDFVDLLELSRYAMMKTEWQRNKNASQCYFLSRGNNCILYNKRITNEQW